jgi:uncharacterized protein (DUF2132 family)
MSVQPKNPLHGVTLAMIVNELVAHYGFPALAARIDLPCFTKEPTITSSLKFLRRHGWAREEVEKLYLEMLKARGGPP